MRILTAAQEAYMQEIRDGLRGKNLKKNPGPMPKRDTPNTFEVALKKQDEYTACQIKRLEENPSK